MSTQISCTLNILPFHPPTPCGVTDRATLPGRTFVGLSRYTLVYANNQPGAQSRPVNPPIYSLRTLMGVALTIALARYRNIGQQNSRSRIGARRLRSYFDPVSRSSALGRCSVWVTLKLGNTNHRVQSGARRVPGASTLPVGFLSGPKAPVWCIVSNSHASHVTRHSLCCQSRVLFTLFCRESVTLRFASNSDRMYNAWPLQRWRWTAQSRASFSDRRYSELSGQWSARWLSRNQSSLLTVGAHSAA
ncbi:hypothetical protein CTA2_12979 [Colletotrichum tanaceti]|nr:hypothetical protein CTA2_12979 [Colletotrichum tanaceti]